MTLLEAVKMAYRKHHLSDARIGWDELDDALCNALCNEIGSNEFCDWVESVEKEIDGGNKA